VNRLILHIFASFASSCLIGIDDVARTHAAHTRTRYTRTHRLLRTRRIEIMDGSIENVARDRCCVFASSEENDNISACASFASLSFASLRALKINESASLPRCRIVIRISHHFALILRTRVRIMPTSFALHARTRIRSDRSKAHRLFVRAPHLCALTARQTRTHALCLFAPFIFCARQSE